MTRAHRDCTPPPILPSFEAGTAEPTCRLNALPYSIRYSPGTHALRASCALSKRALVREWKPSESPGPNRGLRRAEGRPARPLGGGRGAPLPRDVPTVAFCSHCGLLSMRVLVCGASWPAHAHHTYGTHGCTKPYQNAPRARGMPPTGAPTLSATMGSWALWGRTLKQSRAAAPLAPGSCSNFEGTFETRPAKFLLAARSPRTLPARKARRMQVVATQCGANTLLLSFVFTFLGWGGQARALSALHHRREAPAARRCMPGALSLRPHPQCTSEPHHRHTCLCALRHI